MAADPHATNTRPWGPYRLQLALGGAGLAASVLVLAAGVRAVHVQPADAHRTDVAGLAFTYPTVNAAAAVLMALALLGAVVLLVTIFAAVRQVRAHRRLVRALPVTGALPGHPSVLVIAAEAPMAFCAGWLRPRVYVSTAVLDRLSDTELVAVLAHEQHHGVLRDPLRLAVGRVLCTALFFLPILRPLHDRYADEAEITADAAALAASDGASGPLASAMLALAATPAGGVVGISPERVDVAARARAAVVADAAPAARHRPGDDRGRRRARLARERDRPRPGDAEPADRLLAAVRARPRARAGARLPRGRRRPASGPRAGPPHAHGVDAPLRPPGTTGATRRTGRRMSLDAIYYVS